MVGFKRLIKQRLGELLLEKGIITKEKLKDVLEIQKKQGGLLGQILIERKYATEEDILIALTTQYGFPYLPLSNYSIPSKILNLIPEDAARQYYVLPVERIGNILSVVMVDPLNRLAINDIEYITGCKVEVFITTTLEITKALAQYYPRPPSAKEDLSAPAGQEVAEEPEAMKQPGSPEERSGRPNLPDKAAGQEGGKKETPAQPNPGETSRP